VTAWVPDPPGARVSVTCRGCAKPIFPLNTEPPRWEDAAGLTVCVKATRESVGHGEFPDFVFHQPMPDGLRGAPDRTA
jgi:hypothetical protein